MAPSLSTVAVTNDAEDFPRSQPAIRFNFFTSSTFPTFFMLSTSYRPWDWYVSSGRHLAAFFLRQQ